MTEITQADRDAAAEAFYCKPLRNEKHNDDRRVKAFARYREQAAAEERAKIVAWLREDNGLCDCFARDEGECACGAWDDYKTRPLLDIAEDIEAGKHFTLQETGDELHD